MALSGSDEIGTTPGHISTYRINGPSLGDGVDVNPVSNGQTRLNLASLGSSRKCRTAGMPTMHCPPTLPAPNNFQTGCTPLVALICPSQSLYAHAWSCDKGIVGTRWCQVRQSSVYRTPPHWADCAPAAASIQFCCYFKAIIAVILVVLHQPGKFVPQQPPGRCITL
jgi:hypothetical protein